MELVFQSRLKKMKEHVVIHWLVGGVEEPG